MCCSKSIKPTYHFTTFLLLSSFTIDHLVLHKFFCMHGRLIILSLVIYFFYLLYCNSITRAGLSILGALGKFNSSGPPRAIHAEAIVHYSTIRKQHINTRLCMHANTVLILFVKSIVNYCYCVHTTVSMVVSPESPLAPSK